MSSIKKYAKIVSVGISDMFAWRFGFVTITVGIIIALAVMLIFWTAIYAEGHTIGSFSLKQLMVYYVFITLFQVIFDTSFIWDIAEDVHRGKLSEYLVKPISYLSFQTAREAGVRIATITALVLPTALVTVFFWKNITHDVKTWFSVAITICIGFTLIMLFGFILSMLTVYFESPYHTTSIFIMVGMLLSGKIVPLALMPTWFAHVASLTPFPLLGNTAVEMVMGVRGGLTLNELWLSVGWFVLLLVGARVMWRHAAVRYEAGGI